MHLNKRWSNSVSSAFWLVLTVTVWIAFAPIQAGGQAAYIMVIGKSMEPNFHLGDMIIVREQPHYTIGDIVAYKNLQLRNNVFHRIIDLEGGRFILKGDNNSWVDTYHPAPAEVIGKIWIYLPGAGKIIQQVRTPLSMALIVGAISGIFLYTAMKEKPRGSRFMKKSFREKFKDFTSRLKPASPRSAAPSASPTEAGADSAPDQSLGQEDGRKTKSAADSFGSIFEIIFFMLGLIAFASLILGIISLTHRLTVNEADDVNYQHIGIFFYSASAPSGIYDSTTVQRGEPIFPKVTCTMRVDFHYSLFGNDLKDIAGTYHITAQILDAQSGWQRTITLQPEAAFSGPALDSSTNVDLCQIVQLTDAMEQGTDYFPSQYLLTITPHLTLTGKISGRDVQDLYEPQLAFNYDRANFSIRQMEPQSDPYNQSQSKFIRGIKEEPNIVPMFGLQPKVISLRLIGFFGLVLALAGMWMLERYIQASASKSPQAVAQMKYNSMLIDVQNSGMDASSRIVEVNSIDNLAKLAERYNVMILHETRVNEHIYIVRADGTTYRYSNSTKSGNSAEGMSK